MGGSGRAGGGQRALVPTAISDNPIGGEIRRSSGSAHGATSRSVDLPAGPPSRDAVLIACAYLVDLGSPWVMQSLFLSVIGEARDRGVKAIETFGYRYPEGESGYERFFVHRTIFPSDFLADFGFYPVRWDGRVALARLELGGLQPVAEGARAKVLRQMKEAFAPAPVPQRPV